jgi:hypothetical protein
MDISNLAKTPKLAKLDIDDQEIIDAYGETVSFWMIDHLDVSMYFNFYKVQQHENGELLNEILRKLILKEDGTPALLEGEVFPTDITLAILMKVNDFLGKSKAKTST